VRPAKEIPDLSLSAIIVAAGRGTRAGGDVPKQYRAVAGVPVLARTIARFAGHPLVDEVVVVIHPDDAALFAALPAPAGKARVRTVHGGATRAESVLAGVRACRAERVLVHDAARPFASAGLIARVAEALGRGPAAAPALPVTDALWRGAAGKVRATAPRDGLFRAQTPQGFDRAALLAAHEAHAAAGTGTAADDVEVALAAGIAVEIVAGEGDNFKITTPEDFDRAERQVARGIMDVRTGNGFDVHRFSEGRPLVLCGLEIPHDRGLEGHSDADVGLHAVTDAIYGALAEGDIGRHFPPSDPHWKGAASDLFLRHAAGRAVERGFAITAIDLTLICERPKIGPHAEAMRARLAEIAGIEAGRVSVKATTSERLGFTGREEGIAALATVTLVARG
jgi:2-C-methyl-D-erythritol 4-phosphate cytidylyltransferase/2-C-methyl-D-erythritol 2,4-cyclodiphosphate synthase